jgi:RNA polymerase sigma-70 factor (ECF subfamily)
MSSATTDEQLARQLQTSIQRSDRRAAGVALDALVGRHYDGLMGYLYRLTSGDRPLAEDIAQEAFLRVLRHIDQYKTDARFKPWLYAIATHIARSHYASADYRRAAPSDDELIADAESPFDVALDADETQRVIAALATLPAHQREVVTLFYYQTFPLSEIAAALGIPVGTVKSRLSLAIKRLRQQMKETDDANL